MGISSYFQYICSLPTFITVVIIMITNVCAYTHMDVYLYLGDVVDRQTNKYTHGSFTFLASYSDV